MTKMIFKKATKLPAIFILLSFLFLFTFCKKEVTEDATLFARYDLKQERSSITIDPKVPRFHFFEGWKLNGNMVLPIAVWPEAKIKFFSLAKKDRRLFVKIKQLLDAGGKLLSVEILLNGHQLKKVEVLKEKSFDIILSKKVLNRGENVLSFKINPDSLKGLNLQQPLEYYKIEKILFEGKELADRKSFNPFSSPEEDFIQPANSLFRLAVRTDETPRLELKFKALIFRKKPAELVINYSKAPFETKEALEIFKIKSSGEFEKKLNLADLGKEVILEFEFNSPQMGKNYLIWQELRLEKRNKEEKTETFKPVPLKKKPHIFYILIDAARMDLVGKKIDGKPVTPNIDQFAQQAYVFENFYTVAPHTDASITTLFSSLYPETHGVRSLFVQIADNVKTLPYYLRKLGYRTTAFLGTIVLINRNIKRDFDNFVVIRPMGKTYRNTSYNDLNRLLKGLEELDFSKPNFVYIHFLPPHEPYNPPPPFNEIFIKTRYNTFRIRKTMEIIENYSFFKPSFIRKLYYCYLNNYRYADYLIGKTIEFLKKKGLFEDSLIVISSDHGEAFFEHLKLDHNSTLYQEMVRIIFLLKMPGQKERIVVKGNYSKIDFLPTIAALLGMKKEKRWEGKLLPLWKEVPATGRKFVYLRAGGEEIHAGLVWGKYKYIFNLGQEELYDLSKDPYEKHNLVKEKKFLALYLKQKLFEYLVKNERKRKIYGIKPKKRTKTNKEIIKELKALGYL